jgi:imidazolonepropionase-like amidohydrolase
LHHKGLPGLSHTIKVCDGEDGVRAAARLAFKRGASFLKMCATGGVTSSSDSLSDTQFSEREIRAAVEEAEARKSYVTIHTHNNEAIHTGLRAGVQCFEHVTSLDPEAAAAIAAAGAAVVPTLTIAHVYPTLTHFLDNDVIARIADVEDGMRNALKLAHEHGILVGSGADLIGPDQKDYGLETALVAEVVGSRQAILTATRDNAKVLRVADRLGTIEPEKVADVVLVAGDPFDDPRLLTEPANISTVLKDGVVVKDIR